MGSLGTHWNSYVNDPKCSFVEFYDLFRIKPGNQNGNYLTTSNKHIAYNSIQDQNFNDVNCGHMYVEYIKRRYKGMDTQNCIKSLFLNINRRITRKLLYRRSFNIIGMLVMLS